MSHDRRECRRIDTAAQQDADGDIRDALSIDRGRQACGQFLDDFVLGSPIQVETRWVVELLDTDISIFDTLVCSNTAGHELRIAI